MARHDAIVWTPEMDSLLGTIPDAEVGRRYGFSEIPASRRRVMLGIPSYRSTRAPKAIPCANCGQIIQRKPRDQARSRKLYCSTTCAAAGQKRRDAETLRYGPGWKNRRAEMRSRDRICRSCGKTPEQNGSALHVHHLKPFRMGGTNAPKNLVALCEVCHHRIEAVTEQVLSSIPIDVSLAGSSLTIVVDGKVRWPVSAHGAADQTQGG